MAKDADTITVEILGTKLQLRGGENPEKVRYVAEFVRERVEELHQRAPTVPSLQLALLTAINLADELYAHEEQPKSDDEWQHAIEKANQILEKAGGV